MTEVAEASTTPRQRPVRSSPTELPLTFLDRAFVEAVSDANEEPAWLRADRLAALERYASLPVESSQLYTSYLDLRAMANVSTPTMTRVAGDTGHQVPDHASGFAEVIGAGTGTVGVDPEAAAAGVRLTTIEGLLPTDEGLAKELIVGAPLLTSDDKLAQLSRAAWTVSIVLHVPKDVRVPRPIVVRWTTVPGTTVIGRTFLVLEDGAEASVVEEIGTDPTSDDATQGLLSLTTEVRLGAHTRLAMASLQEAGPDQIVFQQRLARIGEGADLRWALAQLGGRLVRSRVDNVLAGDRSQVEQVEIVFGSGEQLHDLTSYTRHQGRDTSGQIQSKGVLLDKSRSYMKGLISIEKTAVGTDSYLGEFGMNLSKTARAVAIPSLEIDQPDCRRAAHSSSVGPIDEGQLFYLETRGIEALEARKFIVLGFLEPVVARVPLEEAQDRLRDALEAKWSEGFARESASAA